MTTFKDRIYDFVVEVSEKCLYDHLLYAIENEDCRFFTLDNISHNIEINGNELTYDYDTEMIEFNGVEYSEKETSKLKLDILSSFSDINEKYRDEYCKQCGHDLLHNTHDEKQCIKEFYLEY